MFWRKKLSRRLTLSDGTQLKNLADARRLFLDRFASVTHSASLAHAGELLLKAAETGEKSDVEAATDQIERTLTSMRLITKQAKRR